MPPRPSREELEICSCRGKVAHATRAAAAKACHGGKRRRGRRGKAGWLEVYHCPFCNYYHVGHGLRRGQLREWRRRRADPPSDDDDPI